MYTPRDCLKSPKYAPLLDKVHTIQRDRFKILLNKYSKFVFVIIDISFSLIMFVILYASSFSTLKVGAQTAAPRYTCFSPPQAFSQKHGHGLNNRYLFIIGM